MLLKIALWTLRRFGPAQAEAYEAELIGRCEALARGGLLGQDCAALADGGAKISVSRVKRRSSH